MESRDMVFVSRLVSRPIFASLGLGLLGFRSRLGLTLGLEVSSLETLTIAKKWFINFL